MFTPFSDHSAIKYKLSIGLNSIQAQHFKMTLRQLTALGLLVITFVSAREFELESFTPAKSNEWLDYGTVRVAKHKRNTLTVAGNFEVKKNLGAEKKVKIFQFVFLSEK